jgi:hypothetical protein
MMGDPWTDPDTNPPPRLVPEDFDPVATALSVPATCELTGDLHGFNPHVTCSSPGSMEACAEVSSPGGRSCTTFTVNP